VGNPHNRRVAQLKTQLLGVAEARLPKVVSALFDRAEVGDVQAAELIFKYALGRPSPGVDVDRVTSGLDELQLLLARPFALQVVLSGLEAVTPGVACQFLNAAHAARTDPMSALGDTDGGDDDDLGEGGVDPRFALLLALKQAALFSRAARKE
jgi:hypothetical protein